MSPEHHETPAHKKPGETFGFTEQENLFNRVRMDRFQAILDDEQTIIHKIQESSNSYGDFLFVTASRPGEGERLAMTFFGLGYHEQRERWINAEWFWYQSMVNPELLEQQVEKEEAREMIKRRMEIIQPYLGEHTQTERGRVFEILADLTDEDGAWAEMEDLESLDNWLGEIEPEDHPETLRPCGENLLDEKSREKLPLLYHGEERGLDALAQVKFFTPDSDWTWYASEFNGEDIFFGLVSGFEVEFGYFSLKELQEARGPMGLQIERDLFFEPETLGELEKKHRKDLYHQPN